MNEHQKGILFQKRKDVNTHHFFKLKPTNVSLLSSLVWFVYQTKWQILRYDWLDHLSIKLTVKGQLCIFRSIL